MFVASLGCSVSSTLSCTDSPAKTGDSRPVGVNIARGTKYRFDKMTQTSAFMPNYPLSTDKVDKVQLTDGEYFPAGPAEFRHDLRSSPGQGKEVVVLQVRWPG